MPKHLTLMLTLVVALAAISARAAEPPVQRSFGGLNLGDSGDTAVKLLGEPAEVSSDFQLPQEVAPWGAVTYKVCDTARLIVAVGKISPFEARILQMTIEGAPCDKTAAYALDKISLGSTRADIVAAYGEPEREIKRDAQKITTIAYHTSNVAFTLSDDKVIGITVQLRNKMMMEDLVSQKKMTPAQAWSAIGDMRVRGRQLDGAREAFLEVLELEPKNTTAHLRLGGVWYSLGDMEKADASYRQVLAAEPNNAVATYNLGRVAVRREKLDDGRKLLVKATALDPANAAAYNELGLLDEHEKKLGDAEKNFRRAVELAPTASQPLQNLGRIMLRRGNKQGAIDSYSEALVIELRSQTPDKQVVSALRQTLAKLREGLPSSAATAPASPPKAQP